jgi:ketosteroid isomerase-like protein
MDGSPLELANDALAAWRRGDFEAVERALAADVEWRWWEPGDWDCHGRDDVVNRLRERYEQGFAAAEVELRELGPDVVAVLSQPSAIGGPDWPEETATVMRFAGEKVVSMQDYPTEAEALAAVET